MPTTFKPAGQASDLFKSLSGRENSDIYIIFAADKPPLRQAASRHGSNKFVSAPGLHCLCPENNDTMESLKELYKIGNGPSSSHTMGPKKAAERFAERCHDADAYRVTLCGSLAATGKGHLTDAAILSVLEPLAPTEIVWKPEVVLPFHPNGMLFEGLKAGNVADS